MATTQINTRIEDSLKARGDAVLERYGKSASEAIRGLWLYMAEKGTLPDFLTDDTLKRKSKIRKLAAAGAGLTVRMAKERGLRPPSAEVSYNELRDLALF